MNGNTRLNQKKEMTLCLKSSDGKIHYLDYEQSAQFRELSNQIFGKTTTFTVQPVGPDTVVIPLKLIPITEEDMDDLSLVADDYTLKQAREENPSFFSGNNTFSWDD